MGYNNLMNNEKNIKGWVITVPYVGGRLHGYVYWRSSGDRRTEAIKRFIHKNYNIYSKERLDKKEKEEWKKLYKQGYRCIKVGIIK